MAITFNQTIHRFESCGDDLVDAATLNLPAPLTVIVQVTRRCNLACDFCSESEFIPDPSADELRLTRDQLRGVQRVYLSGGEPLLRDDIISLLASYRELFPVLGLPSNAINVTEDIARQLRPLITYANIGLDGPRTINNQIRGRYDDIIRGIHILVNSGIEVSLSMVLLRRNIADVQYVCQIADTLGVTKLKLVLPVPRGRALNLPQSDILETSELLAMFEKVRNEKERLGWHPTITLTAWGRDLEGYALLVYPGGKVVAWPVFGESECVKDVGNILQENIQTIWQRYPYRTNHIRKYLGHSIHIAKL